MNPVIDLDAHRPPRRPRPAWQAPAAVLAVVLLTGASLAALTLANLHSDRAHTEAQHAAQATAQAAHAGHATQAQHLADLAAALQSQEWRIQDLETEGMARAERITALEALTGKQADHIENLYQLGARRSNDIQTAEESIQAADQRADAAQRKAEELERDLEELQREVAELQREAILRDLRR